MDCEGMSQLRMRVIDLYIHGMMIKVGRQGTGAKML